MLGKSQVEREAASARRPMIGRDRWRVPLSSHDAVAIVFVHGGGRNRHDCREAVLGMVPLPNISMVFLLAVLFSAVSFGKWLAIYASLLSFLAYDFFFIEPLHTFQITEPSELLSLIIFLIVAIVSSALAGPRSSSGDKPSNDCNTASL